MVKKMEKEKNIITIEDYSNIDLNKEVRGNISIDKFIIITNFIIIFLFIIFVLYNLNIFIII